METMNLAYIVQVIGLIPIPGKDLIEVAAVKGWRCIVKKNQFRVGDLAVYLAIGSVPDFEDANFRFLKEKGMNRIKTIKMGGVISQGLLGPLSWLTERGMEDTMKIKEGDDVALLMGVTKFIPPEEDLQYDSPKDGAPKHAQFPDYVPKTDATRLQHAPDQFFADIIDKDIVITRKEDGCSGTYIVKDGLFMVCGRNYIWDKVEPGCAHYFQIAEQFNLEAGMLSLGRNLAIQGEICGPKINSNRRKLAAKTFSVFDMFDIDKQEYLPHEEVCTLCATLGLSTVPLLYRGPASEAVPALAVEEFLKLADRTEYGPGVPAEGIVVKTDPGELGVRVNFKVISNKYLIKFDL